MITLTRSETLTKSSAGLLTPACQVVVAYEDLETARHAQKSYEPILQHLEEPEEPSYSLWKFNLLQNAKLRTLAAMEAGAANVIIVSTHGDQELPAEVTDWLEQCLSHRRGRPGHLVALFDRMYENFAERSSICHFLRQAAGRAGMEFLAVNGSCP